MNIKEAIVRNLSVEEFLYYYTGDVKIVNEKSGQTYYFGRTSDIYNRDQIFLTLSVKYTSCCLHYELTKKHAEYTTYLVIYV